MQIDLTNSLFHNEEEARAYLEVQRWPDGVICPFCTEKKAVTPLNSVSHGPGWYTRGLTTVGTWLPILFSRK